MRTSTVPRVGGTIGRNHGLVTIADPEQLVLAHDVLAPVLHVVLVQTGLDDRVHRTRLLAETAIDALEQIDVVSGGSASAVVADAGFDGDGERRAHRLAEFARDAALLAVRISAQRVQPA